MLRDSVAECGGLVLLGLVVWTLPSAIEWVADDRLTDLQVQRRVTCSPTCRCRPACHRRPPAGAPYVHLHA